MNMHRMWQAEFVRCVGHSGNDLTRGDVEVINRLIETMRVPAAALPDFDAAGIHDFRGITFRRIEQPSDIRLQSLGLILFELPHDVVVVAHQDVKAFVDDWRVIELFVRVPRHQRRNRRVECRRVAQAGVEISRRKCARHGTGRSRASGLRPRDHWRGPLFFGHHLASGIYLRTRDVAVHIDSTRHNDIASRVEGFVRLHARIARCRNDATVLNPQVANDAVEVVCRVVNRAAGNAKECHRCHSFQSNRKPVLVRWGVSYETPSAATKDSVSRHVKRLPSMTLRVSVARRSRGSVRTDSTTRPMTVAGTGLCCDSRVSTSSTN